VERHGDLLDPTALRVGSSLVERRSNMPVIEVKLYDRRVTEESVPKMIEALTNALHESSGAAVEHIQVIIEGVSPRHWGIAGKQQE
jgi:4-oxalocrotonate tautomerase